MTEGIRGRPTMKDVAAAAGVALKTVSRFVNAEPGVSPATAERVAAAIERLGYRRNESARMLRRGRTATIGLVIEDVADPFYSEIGRAVEDVALRHGSLVFSGSSGEDPRRERELVLAFCARRVDGLVIVPAGTDHDYLLPELDAGVAAVFADRPGGLDADTVLSDNAGGAHSGVTHLIRHGHRRIAFLGDRTAIFTAAERLRGYRRALSDAGLPADGTLIATGPPERAGVALDRMLAEPDPPTAVFAGNGRITVALLRSGHRPPLVGFDDFELADLLTPGVSVVAQDPAGLGRTAAELLFRRLSGETGPARRIELATRLVPRGSGELRP
ncbi:LacI family transcriptional regulator [Planomonospora parontospora subsp. parontospora]|uniref:LacI family transcriptional regulator n=2 Tax=Planomonospora parontospora TaxID=58119 RepID=A0AA37BCT2_9ACTN|nr:LacI family DNA-binding transcriptional regulator [Planomonospora parontospora]GGK51642.1 LacI family transcriptional regulator [Planomonospora parontospora]GII06966.1 LacI family transcriptional regulator [Planomonospora parontospora subsp. parontospora]